MAAGMMSTLPGLPGLPTEGEYDAAVASGDLNRLFAILEKEQGLPAGFLARTAKIESSGNPNAKNPNSSAEGLFQFINSTGRAYGLNSSADKRDPVMASLAAAQLAGENQDYLRDRLGREPTAGELYLAHQQGAGGAANLLANPNAPAASVVGSAAARLNGGAGQTAGQLASRWTSKFGDPAGSTLSGVGMMAGADSSDTLAGGEGGDRVRGINSEPYKPGSDGPNLLSAIGMALLSGTRQNPLGTLPQILQAQQRDAERRDDRRYGMYKDNRDFDLRKSEIERSQANTAFQQSLATRGAENDTERLKMAKEAAAKGEVRTLPDGSTVRVNDDNTVTQLTPPIRQLNEVEARKQNADALGLTGEARTNYILTGKYEGGAGANPYANPGGGKLTEAEAKSGGFADRMFQNEQTFRSALGEGKPTLEEAVGTSRTERLPDAIPFGLGSVAGSFLNSDQYRTYKSAKDNWIAAQLRKESGAVIGPEEYTNADRQYFPQPGDNSAEIERKRKLRQTATEGMARDAGGSYRPKLVYDEQGGLQPYQPGQRPAAGGPGAPRSQPTGSAPRITSQAEYDALPSGSQYVDPNGTLRTKGGR